MRYLFFRRFLRFVSDRYARKLRRSVRLAVLRNLISRFRVSVFAIPWARARKNFIFLEKRNFLLYFSYRNFFE
ncbi:hypothetical protein LEP1GSC052_2219 [Leptospira kmetyi serovar Malaysia str. Bejo-Iso9]|nr:hypothetical protein LEP1GSC052_2219 [Leptospira kmetyi serovar Malaysia str. Bejo-Iso9]